MPPARRTTPRLLSLLGVVALVAALGACSPSNDDSDNTSSGGDPCADPNTIKDGVLTIATDSPAYDPWFKDNDPSNGKGFESAVAYAVAKEMGFPADKVAWTKEPFNASYQPGPKNFDFDINQISITPAREKAVTFSDGYYSAAQAIITMKDSQYANATSLADFKDAKLGAQVGTTSLTAITDTIKPSAEPQVFDDTNIAKNALQNGQIDGMVVDLPTAFYITAVELKNGTIAGQFQPETGEQEQFGLLFAKGNSLVNCANQAIQTLHDNGQLAAIEKQWLSQVVDVPKLTP